MLTRYLLPALAVVAFTFAVLQMTKAQQKPPPASPPVEPARSPYGKTVAGAGLVEPETENIAVGTNLPGIVKAVHVRVDDRVRAGDPLFELDDRPLAAEREVREAALASAKAQEQKLLDMPRAEELPPLRAKVAEAKASVDDRQKLYDRARRAASSIAVAEEEVMTRQQAVEMAKAQLAKAQADLALAEAGAWRADKLVAAGAVKQAEAQLAQTETELARLKVAAPRVRRPGAARGPVSDADLVEFKVLQVNVRPGEYVATAPGSPMVVLGTVGRLHVRVDIDENDIPRFRPGIPGTASPRGSPGVKFPLAFVRVEPYVIPKKSLTGGNTERVDTRVLQVIYAIDAPDPPLYVGQQLDVSLDAGGG
ncbi:MAG: biotin/lipoyl-binding protein [Gemmataceae bacterium]|nr:biotin/lipoyl-binding protein [Gemmataceae bacterium]